MVDIASAVRRHRRCGFDTAVFIYHIENVAPFDLPANLVIEELRHQSISAVTSVLTLTELLVKPLQEGRRGLAARYEALTRAIPNLAIVDVDTSIAKRAAALGASQSIRTVDALQVATAIRHGATAFLTNDARLRRVHELDIIVLSDFIGT